MRDHLKTRRRNAIVTAAAALWRRHGIDGVPLADIAAAAGVSIQTIYNLVGGVDAVKIAVVEELLARLEAEASRTSEVGVARSIERAAISSRLFLADPALYRPLLVGIPRAVFTGAQLSRDGSSFQRHALEEARRLGEIGADIHLETLALQIHLQFLGGLMAWACGTLDDAAFRRAAELAVLAPLAACATPRVRTRLNAQLRELLRTAALGQAEVAT